MTLFSLHRPGISFRIIFLFKSTQHNIKSTAPPKKLSQITRILDTESDVESIRVSRQLRANTNINANLHPGNGNDSLENGNDSNADTDNNLAVGYIELAIKPGSYFNPNDSNVIRRFFYGAAERELENGSVAVQCMRMMVAEQMKKAKEKTDRRKGMEG